MTEDLSVFQKMTGCRVDGIVGLDVLRQSSFVIDYQGKEIHFGHPERLPLSTPFETEERVVTVRMQVENRQLRLVVDTGGPDLMLFGSRVPAVTNFEVLGTENATDV